MSNLFTEHPNSVGESYFGHLKFAWCFGIKMLFAAVCCFIHGVLPFCCKHTASEMVCGLAKEVKPRNPNLD